MLITPHLWPCSALARSVTAPAFQSVKVGLGGHVAMNPCARHTPAASAWSRTAPDDAIRAPKADSMMKGFFMEYPSQSS